MNGYEILRNAFFELREHWVDVITQILTELDDDNIEKVQQEHLALKKQIRPKT